MLSRDNEGGVRIHDRGEGRGGGGEEGGRKQRERGVGEGRIACVNGRSRYTGRGADKCPYCTNFM